jgi:signal transduction histidine kinase
VIIADADGVIVETNDAAARLLGEGALGRDLRRVLGTDASELVAGVPQLSVTTVEGEERLFAPSAQKISPQGTPSLVQVCLVDITEQHRRQEEQRRFGARLLAVQEDERSRLARDLHDDPLQTLMFLSRGLDDVAGDPRLAPDLADLAEQLRGDARLAADVGHALRKVIRGLRPPVLDDLGLVSALRQLVDEAAARPDAPAVLLTVEGGPVRLTPQLELTAYRVVQESLSNVLRHADATAVEVRVTFGDELTLAVCDDGHGLHATRAAARGAASGGRDTAPARAGGFGLLGMRERVAAVGGQVETGERAPRGTVVRARLPLAPRGQPSLTRTIPS